ncbi:hypothetical protein AB0H71_10155 [Nocardia sp. NPDC050697]|uniref:hypothetical protein n=1 Tax=Nocardia sp. NPDC050697 TaxID=3155158 RepID=UPI0033FCB97F
MSAPTGFEDQVRNFALDVSTRVLMCLEGEPTAEQLVVEVSPRGGRFAFSYEQTLHAQAGDPAIGRVRLNFEITLDREKRYLAVHKSSFQLLDVRGKKPITRLEYVRDAPTVPCSHTHVHAESGLFTHFLARTGHPTPAEIQSIHIPTGGDRFRPCVEDFIEFLIRDCRVASREGWESKVAHGREEWRRRRTAAAVRDRPEVAVAELRRLGLTVLGRAAPGRPSARARY